MIDNAKDNDSVKGFLEGNRDNETKRKGRPNLYDCYLSPNDGLLGLFFFFFLNYPKITS